MLKFDSDNLTTVIAITANKSICKSRAGHRNINYVQYQQ